MGEIINSQIQAVEALCKLENSYERGRHFVKAILVNSCVVNHFSKMQNVGDYEIVVYKGEEDISKFLNSRENFSEEQRQKSNLLVFGTEDYKILPKIIWNLRCMEGKTNRKWLLDQIHWEKCYSSLKWNLGDVTLDFNGDFGYDHVKRMIADNE